MKRIFMLVVLCLLGTPSFSATNQSVSFIGYNVEAGYKPDSQLETVLDYLDRLPRSTVYALTELTLSWSDEIAAHLGENYQYLINQNIDDNADAMAIFYDASRLTLSEAYERGFGVHKYERKMVYGKFTDTETNKTFAIVVNHLMRGKGATDIKRQAQAVNLQSWVMEQKVPVIGLGDYNFDLDVETGNANPAYYLFTKHDHWRWIKPSKVVRTGCHKGYNSVLDFAFVSGSVRSAKSEIMFQDEIYCEDDARKPDHRPIYAEIDF